MLFRVECIQSNWIANRNWEQESKRKFGQQRWCILPEGSMKEELFCPTPTPLHPLIARVILFAVRMSCGKGAERCRRETTNRSLQPREAERQCLLQLCTAHMVIMWAMEVIKSSLSFRDDDGDVISNHFSAYSNQPVTRSVRAIHVHFEVGLWVCARISRAWKETERVLRECFCFPYFCSLPLLFATDTSIGTHFNQKHNEFMLLFLAGSIWSILSEIGICVESSNCLHKTLFSILYSDLYPDAELASASHFQSSIKRLTLSRPNNRGTCMRCKNVRRSNPVSFRVLFPPFSDISLQLWYFKHRVETQKFYNF